MARFPVSSIACCRSAALRSISCLASCSYLATMVCVLLSMSFHVLISVKLPITVRAVMTTPTTTKAKVSASTVRSADRLPNRTNPMTMPPVTRAPTIPPTIAPITPCFMISLVFQRALYWHNRRATASRGLNATHPAYAYLALIQPINQVVQTVVNPLDNAIHPVWRVNSLLPPNLEDNLGKD